VAFAGADFHGTQRHPANFCGQLMQRGLAKSYEKYVKYGKYSFFFFAYNTTFCAPIFANQGLCGVFL
jgi:hypothetical protein